MENLNAESLQRLMQVFMQPFLAGFALSTFLELLGYGIFKALSLINIDRY